MEPRGAQPVAQAKPVQPTNDVSNEPKIQTQPVDLKVEPETIKGDGPKTLPQRCQRIQDNRMQCPRYVQEGSKFCEVCNKLSFVGVK